MTGSVVQVVNGRGFGFIRDDGGGPDVFVHASQIRGADFKDLSPGCRVVFEVEPTPRGPRAVDVRLVDGTL